MRDEIEAYLLDQGEWVPARELCALFRITERQLRQTDDQQGLCSGFAISGDKGFKHVSLASTTEWLKFKHRLRKHGIAELVRVRDLDRRRRNAAIRVHARHFEKDSGQSLLWG